MRMNHDYDCKKREKNLFLLFLLKQKNGERFFLFFASSNIYIIHLVVEWKKKKVQSKKREKIWCDNVFFIFSVTVYTLYFHSQCVCLCVVVVSILVISHISVKIHDFQNADLNSNTTKNKLFLSWFADFSLFQPLALSVYPCPYPSHLRTQCLI